MLDCLKSPAGIRPPAEDPSSTSTENANRGFSRGSGGRTFDGEGGGSGGVSAGEEGGAGAAGKDLGGEVVVLHYYQQHHQYLLKVAVLETMNRCVMAGWVFCEGRLGWMEFCCLVWLLGVVWVG